MWITFASDRSFPLKWGKIRVFGPFFVDNSVDNVEKFRENRIFRHGIGKRVRYVENGQKNEKAR